jgi:hypothetical protein
LPSTPSTPKTARVGPTPRTSSCFEPVPLIPKPTAIVLSPVPTNVRTDTLMRRAVPVGPIPTNGLVTARVAVPLTLVPAAFASSAR